MDDLDLPWPEVPALAEVYDIECAGRWDHDFYLRLAAELGARSVVDIGCGTGVFATDLARRGIAAVGVDPAGAVLEVARSRPGGDRVTWVHGRVDDLPSASAELVVMMGHVAQYFVDDDVWAHELEQIRRVLVAGGHLAFETRNPAIDWASRWTQTNSTTTFPHPRGGEFTSWVEVQQVSEAADGYTITHQGNTMLPSGEHLRTLETLRFRSEGSVHTSLVAAGFLVTDTWGDWDRSPVAPDLHELIVLAQAPT